MEKKLQEVINQASGELVLETYIKKSKDFWGNFELEMVRYKDKCKLIKGWDDMFTILDEHINSFQSMSNSPYYNVFKDNIEPWKDKLEKIRLLFNEWVDVQRKWVYLEGIFFGSADIMNELSSDYNKFKSLLHPCFSAKATGYKISSSSYSSSFLLLIILISLLFLNLEKKFLLHFLQYNFIKFSL